MVVAAAVVVVVDIGAADVVVHHHHEHLVGDVFACAVAYKGLVCIVEPVVRVVSVAVAAAGLDHGGCVVVDGCDNRVDYTPDLVDGKKSGDVGYRHHYIGHFD